MSKKIKKLEKRIRKLEEKVDRLSEIKKFNKDILINDILITDMLADGINPITQSRFRLKEWFNND